MSLTTNQKQNSINLLRQLASDLIKAVDGFNAFNSRYTALDLGNTLVDGDFTSDSAGITKNDWVSAVATLQAVALLSGAQRTVLSKVANL